MIYSPTGAKGAKQEDNPVAVKMHIEQYKRWFPLPKDYLKQYVCPLGKDPTTWNVANKPFKWNGGHTNGTDHSYCCHTANFPAYGIEKELHPSVTLNAGTPVVLTNTAVANHIIKGYNVDFGMEGDKQDLKGNKFTVKSVHKDRKGFVVDRPYVPKAFLAAERRAKALGKPFREIGGLYASAKERAATIKMILNEALKAEEAAEKGSQLVENAAKEVAKLGEAAFAGGELNKTILNEQVQLESGIQIQAVKYWTEYAQEVLGIGFSKGVCYCGSLPTLGAQVSYPCFRAEHPTLKPSKEAHALLEQASFFG